MMYPQKLPFFTILALSLSLACQAEKLNTENAPKEVESFAVAAIDLALKRGTPEYEKFIVKDTTSRDGRGLQSGGQKENERCGNNTPCAPGLECVSVLLGKRCKPINCFETAIAKLEETFDKDAYKQEILSAAGYTEETFLKEAEGFRVVQGMNNSVPMVAVAAAMTANPPPHGEFLQHIQNCRATAGGNETEQTAGSVTTLGFMFELGCLGNLVFTLMSSQGSADAAASCLGRICCGGKAGGGYGLNFAYGLHDAGKTSDLVCASIFTSAGTAIGVGGSFANICTLQENRTVAGLELAVGLGCGTGFGVAGCYTCAF